MFKKLFVALFCAAGIMLAPQVKAAVAVEWSIFLQLITTSSENSAVTDVTLRNMCIFALDGSYASVAEGDDLGNGTPSPITTHICQTQSSSNIVGSLKVCENKVKGQFAYVDTGSSVVLFCIIP